MTLTARRASLVEAQRFMLGAGYVPLREGSVEAFLRTAVGDDIQIVSDGGTDLLLVLRHDARAGETLLRAAVKRGGGDAMAMAYAAVQSRVLAAQPVVRTDVPAERLRGKLTAFTQGLDVDSSGHVMWYSDLRPLRGGDV